MSDNKSVFSKLSAPTWCYTFLQITILTFLASFMTGCVKAPQRVYYTLDFIMPQPIEATPRFPLTIRLKPLDISRQYNDTRIVHKKSLYEVNYYQNKRWAVKPQKMISDLLLKYMIRNNLFRDIGVQYRETEPDYEIMGEIDAIEKFDSKDVWFAHMVITFSLMSYKDNKVVWRKTYDIRKEIYRKEMVLFIRGISVLLEELLGEFVNDLNDYFTRTAIKGVKAEPLLQESIKRDSNAKSQPEFLQNGW